jgi:hypothetical protein
VLELGGALDRRLALGDDPALPHRLLRFDMAAGAVHRVVQMEVEPRRQRRALAVVARIGIEQRSG